jgi:hypothetical protein
VSKQKQRKIRLLQYRLSQKWSKVGQSVLKNTKSDKRLQAISGKLFSLKDQNFSITIQRRGKDFADTVGEMVLHI